MNGFNPRKHPPELKETVDYFFEEIIDQGITLTEAMEFAWDRCLDEVYKIACTDITVKELKEKIKALRYGP